MAEYNQLLAQNYNVAIRTLLGLDEQEGVNAVAPELVPVIAMLEQPDMAYLFGWRRGAGFSQIAGVAGQVNHIALVNPAGSGVLAIAYIDELRDSSGTVAPILAMIRDTTLTVPIVSPGRAGTDSRQAFVTGGNLACTVESQQSAVALTPLLGFKLFANLPTALPRGRYGPYILSPGFGVAVVSGDDAAGCNTAASFEWIERVARISELQTE